MSPKNPSEIGAFQLLLSLCEVPRTYTNPEDYRLRSLPAGKVCLLMNRTIFLAVFLSLCLNCFCASASPAPLGDTKYALVYGTVIDVHTSLPLPNTDVVFRDMDKLHVTRTNKSGSYNIRIPRSTYYEICVFRSPSSSSGLDYVPVCEDVFIEGKTINLSFSLSHAAVIRMKREPLSYKTLQPPRKIQFTVISGSGLSMNATSYSKDSIVGQFLGIKGWMVFVPPEVLIKVGVEVHYSESIKYSLLIDQEEEYFVLRQGDLIDVDLEQNVLPLEISSCHDDVAFTWPLIHEAEGIGFYVAYEKNELLRAESLLEASAVRVSRKAYDSAYADLREAYILVRNTGESIRKLFQNASVSTLFITPFLCFTAFCLAALLSEKRARRLSISLVLYGLLLLFFHSVYPGYILIGVSETLRIAAAYLLLVYPIVFGLPYLFQEKPSKDGVALISAVTLAFSLATRNIRRRRLRALLMLIMVSVSVFALIAITSFSLEHGYAIQYLGRTGAAESLVIRKKSTGLFSFGSIGQETYSWLKEHPEVTLFAPKIENIPQESPLGFLRLQSSDMAFPIHGIVGVAPSQETRITPIDSIIVEGRFLEDDDLSNALISDEAAANLGVEINDTLQFLSRSYTVTGFFCSSDFDRLKDLDGGPFAPYIADPDPEIEMVPCLGREVVILLQEVAQGLSGTAVSRIAIQIQDSEELMPLARQAVLKWEGVEGHVFLAGRIYRIFIGPYYLAKGFLPASVPLAMAVLNIAIMMRSTVHERKRELMVMSTLGISPLHMTFLFVAEALTMGIVGGSLGYLLGISGYRLMALLPSPFQVRQKVDAIWGIVALSSSISAVSLGSALPALKSTTVATPSLVRKWKFEGKPMDPRGPWDLVMPIRIRRDRLNGLFRFIIDRLKEHPSSIDRFEVAGMHASKQDFEPFSMRLLFTYVTLDSGVRTRNELICAESIIPNWYLVKLTITLQGRDIKSDLCVRTVASLIRHLVLVYNTTSK